MQNLLDLIESKKKRREKNNIVEKVSDMSIPGIWQTKHTNHNTDSLSSKSKSLSDTAGNAKVWT